MNTLDQKQENKSNSNLIFRTVKCSNISREAVLFIRNGMEETDDDIDS